MGLAFTDTLVERVRRDGRRRGSQRPARRALDDGVSVRAAASAVGLLRRELSGPRQRHHRPRRLQRGVLRAGERRRGVRVLRRGDAAAAAADGPGDLPPDERVPRRRPRPHARRRRDRGDRAPRRHAATSRSSCRRCAARPTPSHPVSTACRPTTCRASASPRPLRDRRRGQDGDGRLPVAAAARHRARRG